MKARSLLLSVAIAVSFLSAGIPARADEIYLKEVESLLNSVSSQDPSRPILTLRLADAYFDEALALSIKGQLNLSAADNKKLGRFRQQAVQLYEASLSGLTGLFPVPTGAQKSKIRFQLSRLYSDMGRVSEAVEIWKELSAQVISTDIKREALLRLAENLEGESTSASYEKAESHYKEALKFCSSIDVCSYIHYRLSWTYYRQNKKQEAVNEVKLALWDSKGQIREEALRDLITFSAEIPTDGINELIMVEELDAKLKRATLYGDLADAFFAAGNKKAGVYVLEFVVKKTPSLPNFAKLLEEHYGFRDWSKFNADLTGLFHFLDKPSSKDLEQKSEAEKIIKRLTVQLDGERASNPDRADEFKRTVLLYLTLVPATEKNKAQDRAQMMEGWLVAETDHEQKIKQLSKWIPEVSQSGLKADEIKMRQHRAASAKSIKRHDIVIEDMTALIPLVDTKELKTETKYHLAYAYYESGNIEKALPLFQDLAKIDGNSLGTWALKSEHLALDILAKKKAYAEVIEQAKSWTSSPQFAQWSKDNKNPTAELLDIQKIQTEAIFERATHLGATQESLETFKSFCEKNTFTPKSCENAQVLASKLGDQVTLLAMLKKLGKNEELAAELEASGRFSEAAEVREKQTDKSKAEVKELLRIAVLYELGFLNTERDRVLGVIAAKVKKVATLGPEEDLIFETFKEVGLLDSTMLSWAWNKENKNRLVDYLESQGKGTKETRQLLAQSCEDMGQAWKRMALQELLILEGKQSKIKFYGKNGKAKFEQRLNELKKLVEKGDCALQATSPEMRAVIAQLLGQSQMNLAEEIRHSAIPDGVDEATLTQLKLAMEEMSVPFATKAKTFFDLAADQRSKIKDEKVKVQLADLKIKEASQDTLWNLVGASTEKGRTLNPQSISVGVEMLKTAMGELHQNPNGVASLEKLKGYYEKSGKPRLAAYFQGRLMSLQKGGH